MRLNVDCSRQIAVACSREGGEPASSGQASASAPAQGRGISRSPVRRGVLSNKRDGPARSARRALYFGAAKYEKCAFRRKGVEIGEAFNPPPPARQPRIVHRERPCIDSGVK